jgi:hypothetical protein
MIDQDSLRENMVITCNGILVEDPDIYESVAIIANASLSIQQRTLEITTGSYTAEYQEGVEITNKEVWITKGSLCEGHTLIAETNGVQVEVGKSKNTLSGYKIVDADGNDVTDNYKIECKYGILEVTEPD